MKVAVNVIQMFKAIIKIINVNLVEVIIINLKMMKMKKAFIIVIKKMILEYLKAFILIKMINFFINVMIHAKNVKIILLV